MLTGRLQMRRPCTHCARKTLGAVQPDLRCFASSGSKCCQIPAGRCLRPLSRNDELSMSYLQASVRMSGPISGQPNARERCVRLLIVVPIAGLRGVDANFGRSQEGARGELSGSLRVDILTRPTNRVELKALPSNDGRQHFGPVKAIQTGHTRSGQVGRYTI